MAKKIIVFSSLAITNFCHNDLCLRYNESIVSFFACSIKYSISAISLKGNGSIGETAPSIPS
jgi:hypothetical protein